MLIPGKETIEVEKVVAHGPGLVIGQGNAEFLFVQVLEGIDIGLL